MTLNDLKLANQDEVRKLEAEVTVLRNKVEVLKVYESNFAAL